MVIDQDLAIMNANEFVFQHHLTLLLVKKYWEKCKLCFKMNRQESLIGLWRKSMYFRCVN